MKGLSVLLLGVAVCAAACTKSSSTSPSSPTKPTFSAQLSPANEPNGVVGGENTGSGNATITFDTTTNSAGQITAATATFVVNLSGFPPGTSMTLAHIHEGAAGCQCPVRINTTLTASDQVQTGASGGISFVKAGIPADVVVVQGIINNPAAYYFNVHSAVNPGGVARGPLTKVQ